LRVLLTNVWLDSCGGTESVIRDVSLGLLRRGHRPIVYSPHLGEPAEALMQAGVAVVDDLTRVAEPPDIIHGHHYVQTAEALIHFPQTPAVQMCHAWANWVEAPVHFPQVQRYIAVDDACRDRLVHMHGIDPNSVEVLYNAIDLTRFSQRSHLPQKPLRALAFTKYAAHLPFAREACARTGMALDVLGHGGDRVTDMPERELANYHLVFATARMALEAIGAGCAVIVCDSRGLSGMVVSADVPRLRALNFGLRSLTRPVTVDHLVAEIARYDAHDAEKATKFIRKAANFECLLDRLLAIYAEAMAAPATTPVAQDAALYRFLHHALPRLRSDERWPWMVERQHLLKRIAQLEQAVAATPGDSIEPIEHDEV